MCPHCVTIRIRRSVLVVPMTSFHIKILDLQKQSIEVTSHTDWALRNYYTVGHSPAFGRPGIRGLTKVTGDPSNLSTLFFSKKKKNAACV